ncbi:hypothetical protein ACYPKM_04965 [Pseudomonas aeruginosa]
MNGKKDIYAPSSFMDKLAADFYAGYVRFRDGALKRRWDAAPAWADCILKPTDAGMQEHGIDPEDWRWARLTEDGTAYLGPNDDAPSVSVLIGSGSSFRVEEKRPAFLPAGETSPA